MSQSMNKKKFFNYAYGIGASIVILGALFKIQHWPFGSEMLTIGMAVEALVFFLSAFESVEEDLISESVFVLEKYLHEFLVDNWNATELSNEWNLYEEDGEIVGSHYYTSEVGEIDLRTKRTEFSARGLPPGMLF